jgi:hypothetical protein
LALGARDGGGSIARCELWRDDARALATRRAAPGGGSPAPPRAPRRRPRQRGRPTVPLIRALPSHVGDRVKFCLV